MTALLPRRRSACIALLASMAALPAGAQTAAYPSRAINVTVGLQAGTGSDVAVRTLAERMAEGLGQPIVVDSLPGAGGALAAAKGAKGTPDGYNLVALSSSTVTAVPILDPKAPFDPFKDLVPIAVVATIPSALFVRPDFPAKTMQEFVATARAKPGAYTYASGGNGSAQHIGMELLKSQLGLFMVHVPYKGSGQAVTDVAGGRVDSGLQGLSTVLPLVKAGKLRLVASTGAARTPLFPDLPTVQEAGVTGFVYEPWTALFAPAHTPREIVERLAAEVHKATANPAFRERWAAMGLVPVGDTPQQLAARMRAEHALNARVIKDKGIRAD